MNQAFSRIKLLFSSIGVYRNLRNDPLLKKLCQLAEYLESNEPELEKTIGLYNEFAFSLFDSSNSGSLKYYTAEKIVLDINLFSKSAGRYKYDEIQSIILSSAANDLNYLEEIAGSSSGYIKDFIAKKLCHNDLEREIVSNLPDWNFTTPDTSSYSGIFTNYHVNTILPLFFSGASWGELTRQLSEFHVKNGCGLFARHKALLWQHSKQNSYLKGIQKPDPIRLSELIGYEAEREEVIVNTLNFLEGLPANNVLLYGDRGTGKSSTVKAILNEYYSKGLRIIEVAKENLSDFAEIISSLRDSSLKFIIFVDDLSFESNEDSFTSLKAVLEGSLESRPSNVLIYATSNRRHLVKEKFSERLGLQSPSHEDEVRAGDTIQEKLSLADRFGITIVFSSPDKKRFLQIVEGIARNRNLVFDSEVLQREALKWEIWYNGRSPRTARQFVDWYEAQLKRN